MLLVYGGDVKRKISLHLLLILDKIETYDAQSKTW